MEDSYTANSPQNVKTDYGAMTIERLASNPGENKEGPKDSNSSQKRRNICIMFMMVIFIICLAMFGYQMTKFLTRFFTYPTVINVAVEEMKDFPAPSLTFCSEYLIDYEKYCTMYSNRCHGPIDLGSFCRNYPHKCDGNKTDIKTFIHFPRDSIPEVKAIAFNTSDVLKCIPEKQDFQEPFIYYNSLRNNGNVEACYTLGTLPTETGRPTIRIGGTRSRLYLKVDFSFAKEDGIYFNVEEQPYGRLYIHSPYVPFERSAKSVTFKAGYEYLIYISLEAERLLPSPYETNCEDYETLWKENKTAALSKEMCQHICKSKSYDFESNFFGSGYDACDEVKDHPVCQCYQGCKDECLKLQYHFHSLNTKLKIESSMHHQTEHSEFVFFIRSNKVRFTNHRPQYMDVELFSYVGGFLGLWLGISILALTGIVCKGFYAILEIIKYYKNAFIRRTVIQNANLARKNTVSLENITT